MTDKIKLCGILGKLKISVSSFEINSNLQTFSYRHTGRYVAGCKNALVGCRQAQIALFTYTIGASWQLVGRTGNILWCH